MTKARTRCAGLRLAAVALAVVAGSGASAAAAPAHIIISAPATAKTAELATQLAAWRQDGAISRAQLLDVVRGARSAETVSPNSALGALAILEFADAAAQARWEKSSASKLAAGLVATRVELLSRLEVAAPGSSAAVFLLAEYDIMVPPARYQEYVDGYVMPQMRAWRRETFTSGERSTSGLATPLARPMVISDL